MPPARLSRLALAVRRFPGRTHYDLTPELFAAGIRELFGALWSAARGGFRRTIRDAIRW